MHYILHTQQFQPNYLIIKIPTFTGDEMYEILNCYRVDFKKFVENEITDFRQT